MPIRYIAGSQLLAMAAIFHPRTRLLREWACAGITFDQFGTFISHIAVHDPIGVRLTPLIVMGLAAVSYILRRYRIQTLKHVFTRLDRYPLRTLAESGSLSVR